MIEFLVIAITKVFSIVIPIVLVLLVIAFSAGIYKKSVLLFAAVVVLFALITPAVFDFGSLEGFNEFGFVYSLFSIILLTVL